MQKNQPITVSVICITYNHEKYIGQALDSFLCQQTNFPIEILVHDDASTDGTRDIIETYSKKYSNIKPFFESENQYSKGNDQFINTMYNDASGTYLALCEGDDFWTDSNKLQRQVDYLNSHSEASLCFHPVKVFFEDKSQPSYTYPKTEETKDFTLNDLLEHNFIQSNSVMYRKQPAINLPSHVVPLDWYTHLYYAQFGTIGYLNSVMSAYRRHSGGIWWNAVHGDIDEIWKRYGIEHLRLFVEIGKLFSEDPQHIKINRNHIDQMFDAIIRTDRKYSQANLVIAVKEFPDATQGYIRDMTERHETAIADLVKHADDQAVIIEHYVREVAALTKRLEQL